MQDIPKYLNFFETHKHIITAKRGIYIYGSPGTGKSIFVEKILKKLNYDIIKFDAGDVRNKSIVEQITNPMISANPENCSTNYSTNLLNKNKMTRSQGLSLLFDEQFVEQIH